MTTLAGKICVSVAGRDPAAIQAMIIPVQHLVDVVEIRLDAMEVVDVARCCSLVDLPLLFTNRPDWEGGECAEPDKERVGPLFEAVAEKAAYIDFELRADPELRVQLLTAMQGTATRMVLSWHDFTATPSQDELNALYTEMKTSGAHIGKLISTAHEPADVLRVLRLQEQALADGFPLSCFCMGSAGRISRLATLYLGGYMSYAALDKGQATASGQLSVSQLHSLVTTIGAS